MQTIPTSLETIGIVLKRLDNKFDKLEKKINKKPSRKKKPSVKKKRSKRKK